jgi:hypothetical protein
MSSIIMCSAPFKLTPAFAVGIMMLLCGMSSTCTAQIARIPHASAAQMTNVIPTNIFLTDGGFLFWHRQHGERVVDMSKIKEAGRSPESRPAQQDSEGHWGSADNGLQMSLRFEKPTFTNGEAINALLFLRNVTNHPVVYSRPTRVLATKDGKTLKRNDDTGVIRILRPAETTVFPQTQQKNHEWLDQIYDLTQSGEYLFQAECRRPKTTSQKVSIIIK